MDLLLWRHAEAVDGSPDHTRELTPRGLKQARRMARWLEDNRPKNLKVLVSPTLRTRQAATAFTDEFEIVSSLGPEGNVADIAEATQRLLDTLVASAPPKNREVEAGQGRARAPGRVAGWAGAGRGKGGYPTPPPPPPLYGFAGQSSRYG